MDAHLVKCPTCLVGELKILSDQVTIPHFGDIVISTMICPKCGYRTSDVIPMENRTPKRYSIIIDDPDKLNKRIVRSGTSTVSIPEIGARIDPGLFSEGFVTNIEGIFRRFQEILNQLLRDMQGTEISQDRIEQKDRALELVGLLGSYIDGRVPEDGFLTLVIEDPMGNSAIIANQEGSVSEEELTVEEVRVLLESRSEKDLITEL